MRRSREHGKPVSAGVLVWDRLPGTGVRVLLAHMGGPFWAHRNAGAWTIPKGLLEPGEAPLDGARREFTEETGITLPEDATLFADLGTAPGPGNRKILHIYALRARHVAEAAGDCAALTSDSPPSNTFSLEWPPHSARMQAFPEIDRLACLPLAEARQRINASQRVFLERLQRLVEHPA